MGQAVRLGGKRSASSKTALPLVILGYSLFVAANSFNLREPSSLFMQTQNMSEIWLRAFTYIPFALASVFLGVIILRFSRDVLRWLPITSTGIFVSGLIVYIAGLLYAPGLFGTALSMVLLGCYSAVAFGSWIRCVMHMKRDEVWLFIIASSVLASLIHLLCMLAADFVSSIVVFSTLSSCSLAILFVRPLRVPDNEGRGGILFEEKSRVSCVYSNQGVLVVALGALGFVSSSSRIILGEVPVQQAIVAEMAAVVLAGILLFSAIFIFRLHANIKASVLCSIPVVAVACSLVPFFGDVYRYVFLGLSTTCFTLGLLLLQITSFDYGDGNTRISVGAYSILSGSVCLITILGYYLPINEIALRLEVPNAVVAALIGMLVLVLGLSIERISLLNGKNIPVSADPANLAVETIASQYGLTEKETEVLLLMANGRDVPSIAKQLYVSQNTIRTHNKHIFQKMSVHSRQECIDEVMKKRAR